jgi:hypothetical protein
VNYGFIIINKNFNGLYQFLAKDKNEKHADVKDQLDCSYLVVLRTYRFMGLLP